MLKLVGACLILGASLLYGYMLRVRLSDHVGQLIGMKEMLLMLAGEISYTRTPLGEAFLHMIAQGKEPYKTMLTAVRYQMEHGEVGKPLHQIWKEVIDLQSRNFLLSDEEVAILQNAGNNFGYLDASMQLKNIEVYIQQVEVKIVQAQNELAAKQKVYQYLSVMCGLFFIIMLL
ncbi:stage III sporulation protein AB [Lachnospiraceae bacterium ZAX-1]